MMAVIPATVGMSWKSPRVVWVRLNWRRAAAAASIPAETKSSAGSPSPSSASQQTPPKCRQVLHVDNINQLIS